jgi:hypothetical protein
MPRVTYKTFMLSVIMLNVFLLSVIMLGVVGPNKLKAIFASVVRIFSFVKFFCLCSVKVLFVFHLSQI